jgi:Outer membrane lipoprotein carrier protein LolA-like
MKLLVVLCLLLWSTSSLSAAAMLDRIQSMLAKPDVLCGRFDQNKQLTGLKKPLISAGRFCVVADKGVLWRTLQPVSSTLRMTRDEIIQLQGNRVTMRLDANSEPTVRVIHSIMFALLGGNFAPLESLFAVGGGVHNNEWNLEFKAREPGLRDAISDIAMEGGAYVKSITIHETSGSRTTILFSAIQTGDGAMNVDEAALF